MITSPFTDPTAVGKTFRVKVLCYNVEGETYSDTSSILLADSPLAPLTQVRKVQSLSTTTRLALEFDALPDERLNGATVLSYSLEIDNDLSGNFVSLIGFKVDQLGLTHIESGLTKEKKYAFRYRVRNVYGWSAYSPTSYLLVAVEPGEC